MADDKNQGTGASSGRPPEVKKDPKRFERPLPPMRAVVGRDPLTDAELCARLEDALNDRLNRRCKAKEFTESVGRCGGQPGVPSPVDLVIVIDTSGSMSDEAAALSTAAEAAIKAAAQNCPSDLQVAWFGIEGTWPGTRFTESYRASLGLGSPPLVGTPGDREDGAAAIIDLSDHFPWRAGAARAIFYLGDEALEGGNPQDPADVTAANAAIAAAQAASVTVFTYAGTGVGGVTSNEYARVATETGGQAFVAPVANLGGFEAVLETVICAAKVEPCSAADEPDIVPCIHLKWGDGARDRIETDDTEVLCITVCNPYSNVVLKDLTLSLAITGPGQQPIPDLPDGTPSVMIRPDYLICFGDIEPCDIEAQDTPSCVSREVVLISRGAAPGPYEVHLAYCFDAVFTKAIAGQKFSLELVRS
jgi:hypothetical protein